MPRELRTVGLGTPAVQFPNGTRLELGPFAGVATQWTPGGRGVRATAFGRLPAERDISLELEAAFAEAGIVEQETIHLEVQATSAGVRSMTARGAAADRVVLRPAPPPRDAVQVVWYQDESGGVSWHFPDGFLAAARPKTARADPEASRRSSLRATRGATFTIPTRTPAAKAAFSTGQPSERLRAGIVKLGRKIFKVLLVPLSKVIAKPLETIVGKVERKIRQELIRPVNADNYRTLVSKEFTDWPALDGKRSLLIVHGIFSSTHGVLSALPRPAMERLAAHYQGRVIGFDQLTVTMGPEENAVDFLKRARAARPGGRFDFDIICHSRGGVVSRALAEQGQRLLPGNPCGFGRIFFVAAANAGSPLGDGEHIVDMIDTFTNLITNFPDGPVLYAIEILLAIVKLVAYAAETRLPGLRDMGTAADGYIRKRLNVAGSVPPGLRYAAAASNYEPKPGDNAFIKGRLADSVLDRVFEKAANDLVVPRDGVFAANGHPLFPIAQPLVYGDDDHVSHVDFFSQPRTIAAIFRHLEIADGAVAALESPPAGLPPGEPAEDEESTAAMAEELIRGIGFPTPPGSRRGGELGGEPGGLGRGGGGFGSGRGVTRHAVRRARPPAPPTRSPNGPRRRPPATAPRRRRGPAPAAAAELPPARLEREPEIVFHERVEEGKTYPLTVRLAELAAASGGTRVGIELAAGEESAAVDVRLHAPGFDVQPSGAATMTVHRDRDPRSEEVTFKLKARNPGKAPLRREITAQFWLRNAVIGSVTHFTYVIPKGFQGQKPADGSKRSEAFAVPAQRREDCDLVLTIEGRDLPGESPFRVQLRSEIPGYEVAALNCGLLNLQQRDLGTFIGTALDSLIGQYPDPQAMSRRQYKVDVASWNQSFLQRLNALGKQLWTLLPPVFRDEYFRLYQAGASPRSILVHSDEMLFPWELVIPNEVVNGRFEELAPLGIAHVLGRWRPQLRMRPSPQRREVSSFVVLNPVYTGGEELPWSVAEVTALRKLFPKAEAYSPATAARIQQDLLQRTDVRVLHFSGHGRFDPQNADLSELLLESNSTLDALTLARTRLGLEASPVAYLNACSVGSAGVTVGRAGGFAAACLDGGFSGVIAPYWPVNDQSAAQFSVALYQKLRDGRAIGEALRELRDDHRDDPTFLGFAYFGDPWTRLSFADLVA